LRNLNSKGITVPTFPGITMEFRSAAPIHSEITKACGVGCALKSKRYTLMRKKDKIPKDPILGGSVFEEKNITVSDEPGLGIRGIEPGKVIWLD